MDFVAGSERNPHPPRQLTRANPGLDVDARTAIISCMQHRGFDPTRRNRKIGTADAGWKKPTPFVVPERWCEFYYQSLRDPVVVDRIVHGERLTFVIEPTRAGFVYACTPDDVAHLLGLLPRECIHHIASLAGVIFRQPTAKQKKLSPVWGRMIFATDVRPIRGPALYLEAQRPTAEWVMPRKANLEWQDELARMEQLALGYRTDRRGHRFRFGLQGLRRWLLYHTVLHEIGHWVDFVTKVEVPRSEDDDDDGGDTLAYWRRPVAEREAFAHRFSDEQRDRLIRAGGIPFARRLDPDRMRAEGLEPEWFAAADPSGDDAGPPLRPRLDERRLTRLEPPPIPDGFE